MQYLGDVLSIPLGYLMYLCFDFVSNFGLAIVIFTLLTKLILLPISLWLQKNGVKIVKITPDINRIKATYFGDKDMIAEKTSELYKKEKYNPFASIIPLLIQVILLMGLVQVIYNPLTHLFRMDAEVCTAMVQYAGELGDINTAEASAQMKVVDMIKDPEYYDEFYQYIDEFTNEDPAKILPEIKDADMSFIGEISFGLIPISEGGVTLLMPIIAALAAWLLCIGQNRLNPLQSEQGKWNKLGTTLFSVCLSLFLGLFVPLGVGFYWVCSNIFAILQQVILNTIINPQKYIDYEELEKSREELSELMSVGENDSLFKRNPNAKREKEDYKRFFSIVNKHFVIYSEGKGYYKYFKDFIEYIIDHSNIIVHYITSDPNDGIFEISKEKNQIKPYYVGEKKLITLMMKMDADIVLMTTPDLDNYYIKRSYLRKDIEYIYVPHGVGSGNLTLRTHALDNFDTIFCMGQNIVDEQRAIEKLYDLPQKNLVNIGYSLIDNMARQYAEMEKKENEIKTILIAPSWQKDNILDLCLDELLEGIIDEGYRIIIRPHPQYVRIYSLKMQRIINKYKDKLNDNFIIQTDFSSNETVYSADLVITDWSSIGYEFSFTTYKPTLYINTPMKIMNPDWDKIDVVPFDIRIRDMIGVSLDVDKLEETKDVIDKLIEESPVYHNKIAEVKKEMFFNMGESAKAAGTYIMKSLQDKQRKKAGDNICKQ